MSNADETPADPRPEYVAPEKEQLPSVTGRPNDIPVDEPQPAPLGGNSTFADRAKQNKAQQKAEEKQIEPASAENKAVTSAATKAPRTRKASK